MRVLIRTRPLDQGNYGGILQAYALQRALESIGVQPVTDLSRGDEGSAGRAVRDAVKRVALVADVPLVDKGKWVAEAIRSERDRELRRFVSDHIVSTRLFQGDGSVDQEVLDGVDAFLVGSDQVWRPAYGQLSTYLFDFLPAEDRRPRVAYAASFGTGDLREFSSRILARTRPLAGRLTATSVREESGLLLCKEAWGIDATHTLDPVMLLDADHFRSFFPPASGRPASELVTYVLDPREDTSALIAATRRSFDIGARDLLPVPPPSLRAYRRDPLAYSRPPIEEWLAAIAGARFVVTDSFHGTVFAILNHVPFLSVVNHSRGAARFESILGSLGLLDRAVDSIGPHSTGALDRPVDWDRVDEGLATQREASFRFLRSAFGVGAGE